MAAGLLGGKIRGLVFLRVLKSKVTSLRGMVVPFGVLSRNILEENLFRKSNIVHKFLQSCYLPMNFQI